jgi:hypothetical protein
MAVLEVGIVAGLEVRAVGKDEMQFCGGHVLACFQTSGI